MSGPVLQRFALAAALVVALAAPAAAQAPYPDRPITLIVPWGAGGAADAIARVLARLLEKSLAQPVSVVNRVGRDGAAGHEALAAAPPDGYTIGLVTAEIGVLRAQGLTSLTGAHYAPLALVNADAAALLVRADAPYRSAAELVAAIRANPGMLRASGNRQAGLWHLAFAGMLKSLSIDPAAAPWVPSYGVAPALEAMATGRIDLISCSLPEVRSLIDTGKIRSLAVMDASAPPRYASVPTLKSALGTEWRLASWRGMAAPRGLPKNVEAKLVSAVKAAYDADEYRQFMVERGFGMAYLPPAEFARFMAQSERDLDATLKSLGFVP